MTAVLFCCSSMRAQETVQMAYPQAEWSKAGDILMHTPGQELFYGVIHPAAGLFEDYFDVDVAAEEHQHYMEMLEQNGIRVHTVYNILEEIGIDSLAARTTHCGNKTCLLWIISRAAAFRLSPSTWTTSCTMPTTS